MKIFWNIFLFFKILWKSKKIPASIGFISFGQVNSSWTKILIPTPHENFFPSRYIIKFWLVG